MVEAFSETSVAGRGTLHMCDPEKLSWVEWGMKGAYFKLMNVDPANGRFALLIKLDKDFIAPTHRHVGAVEGMILEGAFHYEEEPHIRFVAGTYLLEKDGAVHRPVSPEGALMFAVFHGPVEVLDQQGRVVASIDWRWHLDTWNAAATATIT